MSKSIIKAVIGLILVPLLSVCSATAYYAESYGTEVIAKITTKDNRTVLVRNNDISSDTPINILKNKKSVTYPEYFNLDENGNSTSVKYQGANGNCWSYGALASLESSLITAGNSDNGIDLSENHLTWFAYNGKDYSEDKSLFAGEDSFYSYGISPYNCGGGYYTSASTLMRRYGANNQTISEDGISELDDSLRTMSEIYLDSAEILTSPAYYELDSYGDISGQGLLSNVEFHSAIEGIKEKLMNVGAVDFSFYEDDYFFNTDTNAYYFDASYKSDASDNGYRLPNHEICIVGWDDNYSTENFNTIPPSDGAWIAKNSWSEYWGDEGFFYISYYDLSQSDFVSFKAEDAEYKTDGTTKHIYKNIYQYDGTTFGATQLGFSEKVESANIFTSRGNETLEAISSVSLMPYSTFSYSIYTDLTDADNPTSGTLAYTDSKTYTNAGYYTIPLDKKIPVDKGEKYSVIISISYKSSGTDYYIVPCEINYSDFIEMDATEGVSFYSTNNGNWEKITTNSNFYGYEIGNATVKAYTNDNQFIGDVNLDGDVDIDDVTTVQCYIARMISLDDEAKTAADIDDEKGITINDATYIQLFIAKLI